MKKMVVLVDSKFKQFVCAYLVMHRVQYSIFTDIYTCEIRVSVPYVKGVRFLTELRRNSVPYELI